MTRVIAVGDILRNGVMGQQGVWGYHGHLRAQRLEVKFPKVSSINELQKRLVTEVVKDSIEVSLDNRARFIHFRELHKGNHLILLFVVIRTKTGLHFQQR